MSADPNPASAAATRRATSAAVRAERARARSDAQLSGAIAALFLPEGDRLDERTRLMLARVLNGIVAAIEADIRRHAARLLVGRGATDRAEAVLATGGDIANRLAQAGLLRDRALIDELLARVRHDLIADALPTAVAGPDEASLIVRLAGVPDTIVAAAATALLAAESRRRSANVSGIAGGSELPAELHHRIVWWIAAAIREAMGTSDRDTDRAIADAAQRSLAGHDEGERVDAVAVRLAVAVDARADELAGLLVEAIGDRQLAFFVAVIACALGVGHDAARAIVIEPDGERLWLALRALALDRPTIARIGLALADADPQRDLEAFADSLDDIAAVDPAEAAAALAPLSLDRDFRMAVAALARNPV